MRCRLLGRDRGSSAVELAVLAPAVILASLLIVQFAVWFNARHVALAAAKQGDLVARESAQQNPQWRGIAELAAENYFRGMGTSMISQPRATAVQAAGNQVTVTMSGQVTGIWPVHIDMSVTGPVECFRTQVSQGASCAG